PPRPPETGAGGTLEQVAAALGAPRRRCGQTGQVRELGNEPRQRLAVSAETLPEPIGVAHPEEELEPFPERLIRRAHGRIGDPVTDEHTLRRRLVCELPQEPRLPTSGLGSEPHEAALPARRTLEQRPHCPELARATDEREKRVRHERPRQRGLRDRNPREPPGARRLERHVLGEDLLLESLERLARFD